MSQDPGVLLPPEPQNLSGPGTIRWAVGNPLGPRSHTWAVVVERDHSVYIGLRPHMGDMKLSLHPAKWRMAFTAEAAKQHLPDGKDRVITRWEHPPELAKGWKHGAVISVPTSNLGPAYQEKRPGKVAWFPAPAAGQLLRFDVLMGEPDSEALTINESIGDVGRVELEDGHKVWIVGTQHSVPPEMELTFAKVRNIVQPEGWAWGHTNEGVPSLLDVRAVQTPEPTP